LEDIKLAALKSSLVRLRTPAGYNVNRARRILNSRFPTANVDANHHFRVQQATFKITARSAANWTSSLPTCGQHLRIGLIDSAVDLNHPALKGQRIHYRTFHSDNLAPSPDGHGTAIAGVLVGNPSWGGLLPGANLFAANVYGVRRNGDTVGSAAAIAKAIDWMILNKVHVINFSIAGTNNKIVHDAIMKAERKGMVIVAAAGNWGRGGERAYPAAFAEVLAVSALTSDRKQLARFSNTGDYIDFTAPGSVIWAPTFGGGGRYLSGTSFAAPFVSAIAAFHAATKTGQTAENLRRILGRQALDMGAKGKDTSYGYGFLKTQPQCS
jgi:subtilisin family serine protease